MRSLTRVRSQRQQVEELEANFGKFAEVADDGDVFTSERRAALRALLIWVGHGNAPFQPQNILRILR